MRLLTGRGVRGIIMKLKSRWANHVESSFPDTGLLRTARYCATYRLSFGYTAIPRSVREDSSLAVVSYPMGATHHRIFPMQPAMIPIELLGIP